MTEHRCKGCGKCLRDVDGWHAQWIAGYITALICPDCQTPEGDLEAAVNEVLHEQSTQKFVDANDDDSFDTFVRGLIDSYPTAEVMRNAAHELAAARPDLRDGPVSLMLHLANDMKSGKL